MKRYFVALACACALSASLFCMAACSSGKAARQDDGNGITVVATIFPAYDWARNIVGDVEGVNVVFLQNSGSDLHSFQPTTKDLATISDCDVFVHVGGESDAWVEGALKNATNKDMLVVDFLDALGANAKVEETVEGMEAEEEAEGHGAEGHGDEGHGDEGPEYDEHVWLSLKNARELSRVICDALCEADSDNAGAYRSNTESYLAKLDALDGDFAAAIAACGKGTLVFGDRFPFRYLVDDYGLNYFAAFPGCSAESEASFETVLFLANKVDELGLSCVMAIEGTNHDIADAVVLNTKGKNQRIVVVDSMQSITQKDVDAGASYLDRMSGNLQALVSALS